MTTQSAPAQPRSPGIDALRGIAILMVLAQHSFGIPQVHLGIAPPAFVGYPTGFFEPFCMPFLLFLSGTLLANSVHRPLGFYYPDKARKVLWPYLVWGVITACVLLVPGTLLTVDYWRSGPHYLWFLAVLIACLAIAPVIRWIPAWVPAIAMLAVLVLADPSTNGYRRILFWGAFVFLGMAVVPHLRRLQSRGIWFPVLAGVLALAVGVVGTAGWARVDPGTPWSFALALPWLALALWLLPRLPRMPLLELAGRASMVLYCVHAPVMIAATWLAAPLAEISSALCFAVVAVVGCGVPFLAAANLRRVRLLFALPGPRQASSVPVDAGQPSPLS